MNMSSINDLPSETLLLIFDYLNWNDLKICGEVNRSWKTAANKVSEQKWKVLCKKEFGQVYEDAFKKAQLCWEDLHKSLRSWSQVKSSKVFVKYSNLLEDRYVIPEDKEIKRMQVLKNGIIGYPFYIVDEWEPLHFTGEESQFTTICYYNADTLEMIGSDNYNFQFDAYEENDDMIVLRETEMKLYVITKSNKRVHCICEMLHDGDFIDRTRFFLIGNRIFYETMDYTLCMTKFVNEHGVDTVDSTPLTAPEVMKGIRNIQSVSYINDNHINILTTNGEIFSVVDKKLKLLCNVGTGDCNLVMDKLGSYGFFWNAPEVYSWLCDRNLAITHLKEAIVQSYGPVVIVGTLQRILHIYYNPYRKGQLKLYKAKPTLKIDLNGWIPTTGAWPRYVSDSQRKINQIDVIEIKDGHRIIILYCQRLVAIELRLDASKRSNEPSTVTAIGAKKREPEDIDNGEIMSCAKLPRLIDNESDIAACSSENNTYHKDGEYIRIA